MWYEQEGTTLDFSKPIIAEGKYSLNKEILMPQIEPDSYTVIGYTWFSLSTGGYDSCKCWKTPAAAIKYRPPSNHKVYNADIKILK